MHINYETAATTIVDAAGAAGGIDEVRRLADRGWPANRPLSPAAGCRVEAGEGEDYDTGTVDVVYEDGTADISWDSCISTRDSLARMSLTEESDRRLRAAIQARAVAVVAEG